MENTIDALLEMDIIPIINENDTVAIDELEGNKIGDNDMLSAIVARISGAVILMPTKNMVPTATISIMET